MAYKKPTYPLEIGSDYVYPITTYDQIINKDGTRPTSIAEREETCFLYGATFNYNSWSGYGPYSQSKTLTAIDGGPTLTSSSTFASGPMCEKTTSQTTNETLAETLNLFNIGYATLGTNNSITVRLFEKPTADIEVIWLIKHN